MKKVQLLNSSDLKTVSTLRIGGNPIKEPELVKRQVKVTRDGISFIEVYEGDNLLFGYTSEQLTQEQLCKLTERDDKTFRFTSPTK